MLKAMIVSLVLLSLPVWASGEAVCEKVTRAGEAAAKRVGKPYPESVLPMIKAGCLKSKDSDEVVARRAQCLDKIKTEAEMKACK